MLDNKEMQVLKGLNKKQPYD
ncbi:hypothetical protein NO004_20001 [Flavobacterium psychrophilum]|nr:hypothetical protein DK095_110001 [Flavobacterium psychrophilum]SNA76700.1 hypothetical protein FI146_270004 [Flavobacterium psychrophilum]SNA82989.1 hypothetical protein FI070_430051 [Flavobacterium psychrophilum]SNB01673.1 hypothetical protein IT2_110050 [Flavobacterium psychrophilum]SNB03308.1 hypothetical protein FPC831_2200004 [Flavobacterium psychrophilum]